MKARARLPRRSTSLGCGDSNRFPLNDVRLISPLLAFAFVASACGGPVYRLPDPPAADEQRDVSLDRVEERERDSDRYNDARRAILGLYDALGNERWDEALGLVSQETRVLLSSGGSGDAEVALATGTLVLDDAEYQFDAVDLLLIPGVREIADRVEGVDDVETDRRKVVHLTDTGGHTRAVVVIYEADAWRVHVPALPRDRVTTSRL